MAYSGFLRTYAAVVEPQGVVEAAVTVPAAAGAAPAAPSTAELPAASPAAVLHAVQSVDFRA